MEEIVLANGKTVLTSKERRNYKVIYYGIYWIELTIPILALDNIYEHIKNNEYVNKMTDIYGIITDGRIFNYILENTLDETINIMNALCIRDDGKLGDYISYYSDNNSYEEYDIVDSKNPSCKLVIYHLYGNFISFGLNGKYYHFSASSSNEYAFPIKNYLFPTTKSARNG